MTGSSSDDASMERIAELEELIRTETEIIGKALTRGANLVARAGQRQRARWREELAALLDNELGFPPVQTPVQSIGDPQ